MRGRSACFEVGAASKEKGECVGLLSGLLLPLFKHEICRGYSIRGKLRQDEKLVLALVGRLKCCCGWCDLSQLAETMDKESQTFDKALNAPRRELSLGVFVVLRSLPGDAPQPTLTQEDAAGSYGSRDLLLVALKVYLTTKATCA